MLTGKGSLQRRIARASTLATAVFVSPCLHPTEEAGFIDRLNGCWEHLDGATREYWQDTGLGVTFGYSVTVRDDRLVFFEDLRIETGIDGMVYIASPGGAPPVRFTSTRVTRHEAVFENAEHDFPQRIAYRVADGRLNATISLLDGTKTAEFGMRRCADGAADG